MVAGRLGGALAALGLVLGALSGCSTNDGNGGNATGMAGSGGGGNGGANAAGSASGGNAMGGAAHVPPMALADDASGITGLEDCALAQSGKCVKPLTRSRAEVCTRWKADRPQQSKVLQDVPAAACNPGVTPSASLQDALRRLNLFRWLGGAEPLALDETWNEFARSCAIIQTYIAPEISHYPEATARCYTEQGYTASHQSQLAAGSPTPAAAIDDLIFDTGDNNFHVIGHRQGMLMPWTKKVGIGFAQPPDGVPATCVRTFDEEGIARPDGLDGVYSFPSPGYVPYEVVGRSTYQARYQLLEWSITVPESVDASAGKVRLVRRNGSTWEDVPVTAGKFIDERFHGLWVNPSVSPLKPGVYAVIVSGTTLPSFGYQIVLEQCDEVPITCDIDKQDCGAGIGCYNPEEPYCRRAGTIAAGQPCTGWDNAECESGSTCELDVDGSHRCSRYCDENNPAAANACDNVCPNRFAEVISTETLVPVGAICYGGANGICDPLAPHCGPGQACASYDPPVCQTAGTTPAGQECDLINGTCAPGATCVGVQGSSKLYCQPFCDMAPGATGPNACSTLCPNAFWDYDTYGLCIPPR